MNSTQNIHFRIIITFLWVAFSGGCGGDAATVALVEAKGTVHFNGKPLSNATVMFIPENGPSASGTTGPDGTFQLTTGGRRGAAVGACRVTIMAVAVGSNEALDKLSRMKPEDMEKMTVDALEKLQREAATEVIPSKFSSPNDSGQTATVSDDATVNDFFFDLKG